MPDVPVSHRKKLVNTVEGHAASVPTTVRVLARGGVIGPYGPRALAGPGLAIHRWGTGAAGGFASLAVRAPDRVGLVDELPRNATGKALKMDLADGDVEV